VRPWPTITIMGARQSLSIYKTSVPCRNDRLEEEDSAKMAAVHIRPRGVFEKAMTFFWLAAMPRYHGLHVHNEDVPLPALANFSLDVCLARSC